MLLGDALPLVLNLELHEPVKIIEVKLHYSKFDAPPKLTLISGW